MLVVPIAATQIFPLAVTKQTPYKMHEPLAAGGYGIPTAIDELFELAGRNCYQSWDRPSPKTASNEGYLSNIITQQHFSVMEHGSVTFFAKGVTRSLLAELTRHRHLSFSVVSQRYVNANDIGMEYPPILQELDEDVWAEAKYHIDDVAIASKLAYNALVKIFTDQGFKRKEAREAARAVLPNMMDTPMVVTGNIRAWRDVLGKRYHIAADREIQEFATQVLGHLRVLAPNSVQDIGEKYGA